MKPDHHAYAKRALSRLESFAPLGEHEIVDLEQLADEPRFVPKGHVIRSENDAPDILFLVVEGWVAQAISLPDGSRQLVGLSLAGDMLGLPTLAVCEPIDHVVALTEVVVCPIAAVRLTDLLARRPRLAALLFLISQEERMLALERLALIGRAPALSRLAALFVRMEERLGLFDEDFGHGLPMPLTQEQMGDMIGVSAVHVNSLIKTLRHSGIAEIERRMLVVRDRTALLDLAGIQPWRRSQPDWLTI